MVKVSLFAALLSSFTPATPGEGVLKDPDRAVRLFTQGCDGGDPYGCEDLGGAFQARGTPADLSRALEFYRRACELGLSSSCQFAARLEGKTRVNGAAGQARP